MQIIILSIIAFFLLLKIISIPSKKVFLNYISTPLITFSITALGLLSLYKNQNPYNLLIVFGLITSITGDVFNLNEKKIDLDFKAGVLFFTFTQLFYLSALFTEYSFQKHHIVLIIIFAVLFIFLNIFSPLKIKPVSLKIEIACYSFLILFTILISIFNMLSFYSVKKAVFLSGMILFALSDVFLTINLFVKEIKYYSVYVWLLYAPAQTLIAISTLLSK